jgi:hypothetical protein
MVGDARSKPTACLVNQALEQSRQTATLRRQPLERAIVMSVRAEKTSTRIRGR